MAKLSLFTVIFLLGLCALSVSAKLTQSEEVQLFYGIFKDWTSKFDKQYGIEELAFRFMNWKSNYDMVQEQNAKDDSIKLEMNPFAALSPEEFSALHLGLNIDLDARRRRNNNHQKKNDDAPKARNSTNTTNTTNATNATNATEDYKNLPKSVDWRKEGAVTPIKNQGQCGGCYSFSAAGALEGLNAIKNKKLDTFSVQQMIDCSGDYGNMGCDGGLMVNAFNYTLKNGIQLESGYQYTAEVGDCRHTAKRYAFKNKGFAEVTPNSSLALKAAVAKQPVSVGIEASSLTVQLFKSGIISTGCSTNLDHAVLVVGYDVAKNGQEYWIIKNSWGTEWGLGGYFNIAMGSQNGGAGVCGINMLASYPTV